ncbi:hypothetical protein VB264_14585 [Arcicella aquatica]|uniref:Uncharacterized protein n=1 Tax=Arcicella aquatica TaxID=217141 RepID=A0ABU5QPL9_9BACT|nr:hypothetical protein [Arcicella aquatica]MEA5259020.1 hypothetical protein [Arcicella aquatica]
MRNPQVNALKNSFCTPNHKINYAIFEEVSDLTSQDFINSNLTENNYAVAKSLGILNDLHDYLTIKKTSNDGVRLTLLEKKDQINAKIQLARLDLEAISSELLCESVRSHQILDYLDDYNSKRTNRLLVGSVILGAVSAGVTSFIESDNLNKTISVGAGLIGAGVGIITINPKGKKVEFYHHRNLLKNIWEESNNDKNLSPFIWKLLTDKQMSNAKTNSLAYNIKTRWQHILMDDGEINQADLKLFFGEGGLYTVEDLQQLESMINQLRSTIDELNQDILSLSIIISNHH